MESWRRYLKEEEEDSSFHYHLSPYKFDTFEQQYNPDHRMASDIGFHFGTKQTALTVADMLLKKGRIGDGAELYLYKVLLNNKSPVTLPENRLGSWSINNIMLQLFEGNEGEELPFVPEELVGAYWNDEIITSSGKNLKNDMDFYDDEERTQEFISWFHEIFGFDSIKYENTYEGGGTSYIILNPEHIEIKEVFPVVVKEVMSASGTPAAQVKLKGKNNI